MEKWEEEWLRELDEKLELEERRVRVLTKYAERKTESFLSHVRSVARGISKREYTQFINEIQATARTGEEYFQKLASKLTRNGKGYSVFLSAYLDEKNYYEIAEKAGIGRKEITKIVEQRAAVVYFRDEITADTSYSPKDHVSHTIWGNLKPNTITPVITMTDKGTGKKYGAVLKYIQFKKEDKQSEEEDKQIEIAYTEYGEYERRVCDAVATLSLETVPITLSSLQIYRVISQNPHAKLTQKNAKEIETAMVNINRAEVTIITDPSGDEELWEKGTDGKLNPEKKRYRRVKSKYYGRMIIFSADSSGEFGGTLDRWTIYERPILYDYAHDKKQVASAPIKKIDVKVRRVKDVQSLQGYLDRRIDTMKKSRKQSRLILWENLYEIDGTAAGKNPDTVKAKQLRTRNKVIKLLDERKETGQIKNYAYKDKKHMKQIGKRFKYHSIGIIL